MEFSLREWLILIGVVIIIAILIDGFRRYKKGQQYAHADNDDFVDPDDLLREASIRRELPNGGARSTLDIRDDSVTPSFNAFENARKTTKAPLADVPHKVDSGPSLDRHEEMHLDELSSLVPERVTVSSEVIGQDYSDESGIEGGYQDFEEYDDLDIHADGGFYDEHMDYERNYSSVDVNQVTPHGEVKEIEEETESDDAEIEEVIVINIFAPKGQTFSGMELLQLVLNCGMRYGEMDIFHRHEDGFDRGKVQFSMANAIEPGTFDLDSMGESNCPGVSFFMGLPGPKNSMKAFDFMLETAQTLVRNLGGELLDERRSPMSDQTIAHCRQRIRDFERRRLMKRKK